jgi:hypothetical protein
VKVRVRMRVRVRVRVEHLVELIVVDRAAAVRVESVEERVEPLRDPRRVEPQRRHRLAELLLAHLGSGKGEGWG